MSTMRMGSGETRPLLPWMWSAYRLDMDGSLKMKSRKSYFAGIRLLLLAAKEHLAFYDFNTLIKSTEALINELKDK